MHLFLLGERGIGKSTILRKTLRLLDVKPDGFYTVYGPDNGTGRRLYLRSALEEPVYDEDHAVAAVVDGCPIPRPEVFDALGAETLRGRGRLTMMDELGTLEREALRFQRAVLDRLDSDEPILGVVKPNWADSWLWAVGRHPGTRLIQVTEENREQTPGLLAYYMREKG